TPPYRYSLAPSLQHVFLSTQYAHLCQCFRCGRTATIARRERTSSRKRLLLGFCSGLVPLRSPQNPAGTSRRALSARRALWGGVPHLKKSSTELDAATGGLQSSPWRCGLSAAEALSHQSKFVQQ